MIRCGDEAIDGIRNDVDALPRTREAMTALRRRSFVGGCAAACVAWRSGRAQQPTSRRVCVAWLTVAPHPMIEPFRAAMRELGYAEGSNLTVESR